MSAPPGDRREGAAEAYEACARIVEKHYRRVPDDLTHETREAIRECAAAIRSRAASLRAALAAGQEETG